MTLNDAITKHAENTLKPLAAYRTAATLLMLPFAISNETVMGGYFNDVENEVPDIVISTEAIHFQENGVWIRHAYTDTYYISGPELHGDTIDKYIRILDNAGATYTLTVTGETIRPNYTWAFAEYDVWEVWSFLVFVSNDLKIDTIQNSLVFSTQDAQIVRDFETPREIGQYDVTRTLAYMLMRWIRFSISAEQGYRLSIYDYTNDVWMRDILQRIHYTLSPVGAAEIEKYLAPADERFQRVTRTTTSPLLGHPPNAWWWYRVPTLLIGGFREDVEQEQL